MYNISLHAVDIGNRFEMDVYVELLMHSDLFEEGDSLDDVFEKMKEEDWNKLTERCGRPVDKSTVKDIFEKVDSQGLKSLNEGRVEQGDPKVAKLIEKRLSGRPAIIIFGGAHDVLPKELEKIYGHPVPHIDIQKITQPGFKLDENGADIGTLET